MLLFCNKNTSLDNQKKVTKTKCMNELFIGTKKNITIYFVSK